MGIKDFMKNLSDKKNKENLFDLEAYEGNKPLGYTFHDGIQAEGLLNLRKRIDIYKTMKPDSIMSVRRPNSNFFENKSVEEVIANMEQDQISTINQIANNGNLDRVMKAIEIQKLDAIKRQQEKNGDGFEQYTIEACNELETLKETVLADRENTPEK